MVGAHIHIHKYIYKLQNTFTTASEGVLYNHINICEDLLVNIYVYAHPYPNTRM